MQRRDRGNKSRKFLNTALAFFMAVILNGCTKPPPSIILFSIDTLRADHLGTYGYTRNTSPHIDEFANESIIFENAISAAPTTAAAHMSIFTSLFPPVHGVHNYSQKQENFPLPEGMITLPQFLKMNGYMTVSITGGGNVSGQGFERGFDFCDDLFPHLDDPASLERSMREIENIIRDWIRKSRREEKPIFFFFHHFFCHDPYLNGPGNIRQKFLDQPVQGLASELNDLQLEGPIDGPRKQFFGPADLNNPEHLQHFISLYDGGVLYSDLIFKEIMDILKEEDIYNDGLIIVTADHGEEFMEHGDILHSKLFRETLNVPLIIRFPDGEYKEKRIDHPVSTIDILPTIIDYLNLKENLPPMQGESLLMEEGYRSKPMSFLPWSHALRIVDKDYTYTNQWNAGIDTWLFSPDDIYEKINLAGKMTDIIKKMEEMGEVVIGENTKLRDSLLQKDTQHSISEINPDVEKQLRTLGYFN